MRKLPYRIVNVFTEGSRRLTGNPLCVFEDGTGLDTATMQALARQFNLSETTFLLPSERADVRVRIFTPSFEMPFAGHPTLGSAYVARAVQGLGSTLKLDMATGIIPVSAAGSAYTLQAKAPTHRAFDGTPRALSEALGLNESDVGERPLWVNAGCEQLLVPLTHEAALHKLAPKREALAQLRPRDAESMVYAFVLLSGSRVVSRFVFEAGGSLIEDPATGSAAANLGGYMLAQGAALPLTLDIAQGQHTGRPASLRVTVSQGREVFVTGEVLELGRGSLEL